MSSQCLGLNNPFCCIHWSRDSQCFSVDWTTPKITPLPWGISTPSNTWFIEATSVGSQTASRSVELFLHSTSVWDVGSRQVDRLVDYVSEWPTKQIRFMPMLKDTYCSRSFDSGRDIILYFGWTVAEGMQTKLGIYVWDLKMLLVGNAQIKSRLMWKQGVMKVNRQVCSQYFVSGHSGLKFNSFCHSV